MKKITCLILLFGYSLSIIAQKSLPARIDQYFREVARNSPAPGFSVVVVKDHQLLFCKGYGVEKEGSSKPMTAQTSTAIGSLTKSITALAILQLAEKGKLRLDDPVTQYLPEFRTANKAQSDKITIRMLLNNTSGLEGGVSAIYGENDGDALLNALQAFYLKKEPGKSYEYSNTAFSIAGLIIQRISGRSYADYLDQSIFGPLAMKHSSTRTEDFEKLHVLYGHYPGLHQGIPAPKEKEITLLAPAGSMLRSSAEDIGHYLLALLNGGTYEGQQILSEKSIQQLWSPQIRFPGLSYDKGADGKDFHYGLGWMISEVEGRQLIHHGGSRGTMSSFTILQPEKGLATTILFNLDYNYLDHYQFASEFNILNNLFHVIEGAPVSDFGNPRIPDPTRNSYALPEKLAGRFLGVYRFSGTGDARNYQGARLEIFVGPDGSLEGKIQRGKNLLRHFKLDFSNEVNAISRNIAEPEYLRFKVHPKGQVTDLFYGGSKFIKLSPAFWEKYQPIGVGNLSFFFPKDWSIVTGGDKFWAQAPQNPEIFIRSGQQDKKEISLKELLQKEFPAYQITFTGKEQSETSGLQYWRQQSFATQKAGKPYQQLILFNETSGFYLIVHTPDGQMTPIIQQVVMILLDTFA